VAIEGPDLTPGSIVYLYDAEGVVISVQVTNYGAVSFATWVASCQPPYQALAATATTTDSLPSLAPGVWPDGA
jgi:hypothetical protein